MKRILELVGRTVPLALLVAHCATTSADSGSQTHWLGVCAQDTDCEAGLLCRCGICTKQCTDGSCANLGRPAECVAPTAGQGTECHRLENMAICRPQCADGCKADEQCVEGLCVATWLGPPCDECNLETQVARLAEPGSEDCGLASLDGGNPDAADCAVTALQAGRPFTVTNPPQPGIDTYMSSAVVFAAGRLYLLQYESSVCGGGPAGSCANPYCGPWMQRQTCVDPIVDPTLHTIAGCGSFTDLQWVCGPNPRCYGGVCM